MNFKFQKPSYHRFNILPITFFLNLNKLQGYVSQLLNQRYGYKVIGLESDEKRIESALKRQKKYFPDSRNQINYIHHFVTENSCNLIQSLTSDQPFVITGLHACADLTISAIKLFLNIENCKDLIIMPCCYHKMEIRDSNFINFPISKALNDVYKSDFINIPFMRLGCQRSSSGWSRENEDGSRIFHLLSRGIMEKYVKQGNCMINN